MNKLKLISLILVITVAVMMVVLPGCKTTSAPVVSGAETTVAVETTVTTTAETTTTAVGSKEITLSLFTQAPGAYPQIFPGIIKNFEAKNPGVKVDMKTIGYGDYQSTLATMLAANEAPDVFLTGQGGLLWGLAQAGEVLKLNSYLDANNGEWRKQMYDYVPDMLSWKDGGVYAIAASFNNMQLGINKDLLTKYGFNEPSTIDDLKQMAKSLKGTGVAPIAFGTADQWAAIDLFVVFVDQQGGGEALRNADLGKEPWTGSGKAIFVKAFQTIKDLTDSGVFMEGATAMNYEADVIPAWVQGKAIMIWPCGNFLIPDIPANINADAVWFPNIPDGKSILTGATALIWCASSKTKYPDLSVGLLKELTTQETYELMFSNGIAPAGPLEKEVKSKYPLADKVNGQQAKALDRSIYTPELYQEIAVAVQSVMAGDITPEKAVEQLQGISDSVYSKK